MYIILNNIFIHLFSFRYFKKIFLFIQNSSKKNNIYGIITITFIIGILIRSILPLLAPNLYPLDINHLITDAGAYSFRATDLIQNHRLSTFTLPGFPIVLSLFYLVFGYKIIFPISFLIIISSFLGIMAYLIALELFNNKTVALISLILIIMNPILIMQAPNLLSDTLALFFFSLIIFLILKDYKSITLRYTLLIGLLIGFTILIRPNYIYLGIIYLFFILFGTKKIKLNFKLKKIALLLIGGLIIVGPWMYYTYTQIGEPTISTNSGMNFFIGNNPQATGWYVDPSITSNMSTAELERGKEPYKQGLAYLLGDTTSAMKLYIKKIYVSIFEPYSYSNRFCQGFNAILFIILNITFVIVELLGLLGLISYRKNRGIFAFFSIMLLSVYLTLIIFFTDFRFILPLIFIFTLFGSFYIVKIYKRILLGCYK